MLNQINVRLPAQSAYSYPIILGNGCLTQLNELIGRVGKVSKILIISDEEVAKLYADKFLQYLSLNHSTHLITFPSGEKNKSAENKAKIEEQMFQLQCDRHTLCVALGGGVVGDLVGFTAATYMRGIRVIQVPTTLLSMLDSSVGGKTAINTSYGKNIIGAFWQPSAVLMDIDFLQSLPQEQIINGLVEAIKIFLTFDKVYVEKCTNNIENIISLKHDVLIDIINRAVSLKAYVVEVDEKEQNLRMSLNFGHTVGHALEKITNFAVLHGYAVGYGILVEAKIAELLGLINQEDYQVIESLLAKINITKDYLKQFNSQGIVVAMRGDKKNSNQEIKVVLINEIGTMKNIDNQVAFPVAENVILQAIDCLKGE